MKRTHFLALPILVTASLLAYHLCAQQADKPPAKSPAANSKTAEGDSAKAKRPATLSEARKGFKTKIVQFRRLPVAKPPKGVFDLVQYDSPVGKLAAYITPNPKDGKKRPAIIWIVGGDCNTIEEIWSERHPSNDQSAVAFRKAGIVLMNPSLRGGNENPGVTEGFLGEIDDIIAAAKYLEKQPHVDPKRIYLGGHSSGGTMVLLASECTSRFRAVFSFGPTDDISNYTDSSVLCPFDTESEEELALRSPIHWLDSIKSKTIVIEGNVQTLGRKRLGAMKAKTKNPNVDFHIVEAADHFNVLSPASELIAKKINADTGAKCDIEITDEELKSLKYAKEPEEGE